MGVGICYSQVVRGLKGGIFMKRGEIIIYSKRERNIVSETELCMIKGRVLASLNCNKPTAAILS